MKRTYLRTAAICCLVLIFCLTCADSTARVFGAGGRGGGARSGGGGGGGERGFASRTPSFSRSSGNLGAAGANRPEVANRPYGGNTFHVGNRSFNIGHNSYQPAYSRHQGYHGYWNGNWGLGEGIGGNYGWGYGHGGYGWSPLGWGLGAWGLGALGYNSGYVSYSNPYYNASNPYGDYNYSQPIPVAYDAPAAANGRHPADAILNHAIAEFKQSDYGGALATSDKGITEFPDDSVLHEFRALALFAQGNYQPAAATIHSLLAVGPGWDWATLSSMYANAADYTTQLRKLEAFVRANPTDGASRFLLAYQYLSSGNVDAAATELAEVVKVVPSDRVAADLLKMASASKDGNPSETVVAAKPVTQLPDASKSAAAPLAPAMLVGEWKAARDDGSTFALTLGKNSTFDWKFTPKDQKVQDFGGTYTVEKNVVALQRKNGGSLIAEVTPGGDRNFNFKLVGGPAEDPGLTFSR